MASCLNYKSNHNSPILDPSNTEKKYLLFPIGIKVKNIFLSNWISLYLPPTSPSSHPILPQLESLSFADLRYRSAKTPYLGVFTLAVPSVSNTHLPESSMASFLLQASICSYFIEESSQVPTLAPYIIYVSLSFRMSFLLHENRYFAHYLFS